MSSRTSTTLPDKAVGDADALSFAFPRNRRVTRGPEIEIVRQKGKRVRTASMDVRAVASLGVSATRKQAVPADAPSNTTQATAALARVGIVVPKYGHGSVERNLVKRRLRELVRLEVLAELPPYDVIIRAAPRAYTRSYAELRDEVRKFVRQLVQDASHAQTARHTNRTDSAPAPGLPILTEPSAPADS